ncbi:hypothetical protein [Gordonia malaquae]|uniref:hypothetical protein n=1 Tax=Gordonia malaquae TaxID=410332 RepID=UPI003018DAF6
MSTTGAAEPADGGRGELLDQLAEAAEDAASRRAAYMEVASQRRDLLVYAVDEVGIAPAEILRRTDVSPGALRRAMESR